MKKKQKEIDKVPKYKLKPKQDKLLEINYFRSEYSLTQKNARNLIAYLKSEYKRTGNEQFKSWASLVSGFVAGSWGRNIVRGAKIGSAMYKILKK